MLNKAFAKNVAAASFVLALAFAPADARAVTIKLNFDTVNGPGSLTGSFDVDTTNPESQTSGFFPVDGSSFISNLNFSWDSGTTPSQTLTSADYFVAMWFPIGLVDYSQDLVPQFLDINFQANRSDIPQGIAQFTLADLNSVYNLEGTETLSVPGPLPLLGAAAAFRYSRKLRKRIKSSTHSITTPLSNSTPDL